MQQTVARESPRALSRRTSSKTLSSMAGPSGVIASVYACATWESSSWIEHDELSRSNCSRQPLKLATHGDCVWPYVHEGRHLVAQQRVGGVPNLLQLSVEKMNEEKGA